METPYVGVAVNYSPHQSSQYLRIYQHLWNRRQVLSAIKLAIHVQLMVLNMVQPTWIGSYQQQSFPMRNIINIEVCYNTKHICKRASTVNSLPWSKFCYCLFRHNHPSYIWLLSLAFFYSTITPTLSTHKIGSIEYKDQAILLFKFHTKVEPESHTSNFRRHWLQLAQSYSSVADPGFWKGGFILFGAWRAAFLLDHVHF